MKAIFVLQARWVLIGEIINADDVRIYLRDASVIRAWGTTQGLGEIALKGLTPKTILDPCGEVNFPLNSVLFSIKCNF